MIRVPRKMEKTSRFLSWVFAWIGLSVDTEKMSTTKATLGKQLRKTKIIVYRSFGNLVKIDIKAAPTVTGNLLL